MMIEKQSNNCFLLHVHKDNINLEDVAKYLVYFVCTVIHIHYYIFSAAVHNEFNYNRCWCSKI